MPIADISVGYADMIRKFLIPFSLIFLLASATAFAQGAPENPKSMTPEEKEALYTSAWELLDETELIQREVFQWRARVRELSDTIKDYEGKLWGMSQASTPARYYAKQIKALEPELRKATAMLQEKSHELDLKMITLGIIEERLLLIEDELAAPLMEAMSRVLLPAEQAQVEQEQVEQAQVDTE